MQNVTTFAREMHEAQIKRRILARLNREIARVSSFGDPGGQLAGLYRAREIVEFA